MKVFVAGATGAIRVTGTRRTLNKADSIRAAGAKPEVVNALNRQEVLESRSAGGTGRHHLPTDRDSSQIQPEAS